MIDNKILKDSYQKYFGEGQPRLFTAPGRINIIGEHTDYNGGFVLPGAVDKAISMAILPNGTDYVNLISIDHDDAALFFRIGGPQPKEQWASYFYGVIEEMRQRGATVGGFNAVFGGDVPLGAGMSSSAALESCVGTALNALFDLHFTKEELDEINRLSR